MAKVALKLIALVLITVVGTTSSVSAAGTATLTAVPGSDTYAVGDTLSVTINEDSGSQAVTTVQADLLYPTTLLQYKNVDGSTSAFADVAPSPSNNNGKLSITRGSITPYTGSQEVTVVNFTVIASGSVTLGFADTSAIYTKSDATNIYAGASAAGGNTTSSAGGTTTPQSVQAPVTITAKPSKVTSNTAQAKTTPTPTPSINKADTKDTHAVLAKTPHTSAWVYIGLAVAALVILVGAIIGTLYLLRKHDRSKPQVV